MQIQNSASWQKREITHAVKPDRDVARTWTHALRDAEESQRAQFKASSNVTEQQLTQLVLAQTLRTIMPRGEASSGGLAADTWRDFLADQIAQAVAPALKVLAFRAAYPGEATGSGQDGR
ncbi:MAG TPA: hypothetical protein PKD49_13745 [Hyphomicrobium sp.]|nr:hypothetical protein [Hyphomicrobium sp.]